MIKVLTINTTSNKGGAARIASTIHNYINEHTDYKSEFAFGRKYFNTDINDDSYHYFGLKRENQLHGLITRFLGIEGKGSYFSTRRLIKMIKKGNYDLIHLHNVHGYYVNFSLFKYLKKHKIPIIWTFHDAWPITGSCAYFYECEKWVTGCHHCSHKLDYPKNYLDRSRHMWNKKRKIFSIGLNLTIVTPSDWLKFNVKRSYLKNYKIRTIYNGIDHSIFHKKEIDQDLLRVKYNIPLNQKVILFIANDLNDPRKGFKQFVSVVNDIQLEDVCVVTAGNKVGDLGMFNKPVYEMGYIANKDILSDLYNLADVYCITSTDDNFPTTIIESMACGTPVVGFNVGGIIEQIGDDCGFVVTKGDIQAFSGQVVEILTNEELSQRFSLNGMNKVQAHFTKTKMCESYIDVYEERVGD